MIALGSLKTAVESRRTLVVAISGRLVAGTYTVVWQIAGDDGHPVRGRYAFTIAPGAQPAGEAASGGEHGAAVTAPGQSPPPASHYEATSLPEGLTFGAECAPPRSITSRSAAASSTCGRRSTATSTSTSVSMRTITDTFSRALRSVRRPARRERTARASASQTMASRHRY